MSWFSKFKDLITRKNKKQKEEGKKQFIPPEPKFLREEKIDPNRKIRECKICQGDILPEHAMRKEKGTCLYFHTNCIKEAKKFLGF